MKSHPNWLLVCSALAVISFCVTYVLIDIIKQARR